jgi:hypothetical protein
MLFVELSGKQQKHKRYTMDDHIDILDPLTAHHRGFPKRRDNHLMEMPGTNLPANQNTHTTQQQIFYFQQFCTMHKLGGD